MVDFDVLKSVGSTNERLKEIFTVRMPANTEDLDEECKAKIDKDIATAKRIQDEIGNRLAEQIQFNLKNHPMYSAVDLAWDSDVINKATYPLMLYAQEKLDMGSCAKLLGSLGCAASYVSRDEKGNVLSVNLPKFFEANVNLVRSVITRRLAAQSNKYNNLFPYFKYEARSTGMAAKLKADVVSQRVEIIVDQYDYRHLAVQAKRDMMLYGHAVTFAQSSWERQITWIKDPSTPEDFTEETLIKQAVIMKEGIPFAMPHPTRVFADNAYPLSSINTDTGCEYIGYWDVARYRDVKGNMQYWNTADIAYSTAIVTLFSTYAAYFSQYYCTIKPPANVDDLPGENDRKNNMGLYAGTQEDSSMLLTHYFKKMVLKDYGIGTYPWPVWVRFVVAGDQTVIFAEIMPSTPAIYWGHNENDSRQVNISMAHELMGFQDQLTNLLSYLLLTIKADNMKVMVMDIDVLNPEQQQKFRQQARGENYYNETMVVEVSRQKMKDLGIDVDQVITMVQTKQTGAIDMVFRAIIQLLTIVDRLMALSPQEQGQAAPREISATETNLIAGTTESVYGFISDSVDEARAAWKRMLYESLIALGNPNFRVPVIERYSDKTILDAGFQVEPGSQENVPSSRIRNQTITGDTSRLFSDYIFTTRDGAERSINSQAAAVLVQSLAILQNPVIMTALGKERFYEIINEVFRLNGSGMDLRLSLREGESDSFGPTPEQQQAQMQAEQAQQQQAQSAAQQQEQMQGIIQQIVDALKKNSADIETLKKVMEPR